MSDTAATFEQAAGTYDRVGVDFFGPLGEELVRRAALRPGDDVLDVGCGRGAVLFPAARAVRPGGRVTGIDAAPTMVSLTEAEAIAAGLDNVTVVVGDAQRPALPERTYDAVTAGLVVFLLPDPAAALGAYARLLRPGGRFAMSTFARHDPVFVAALRAMAAHVPAHHQAPDLSAGALADPAATRAILLDAGFAAVDATEDVVRSRFTDEQHWLTWCWSHGARAVLQAVPDEALPAAVADAFAALRDARTADGELELTTRVRFTVARV